MNFSITVSGKVPFTKEEKEARKGYSGNCKHVSRSYIIIDVENSAKGMAKAMEIAGEEMTVTSITFTEMTAIEDNIYHIDRGCNELF